MGDGYTHAGRAADRLDLGFQLLGQRLDQAGAQSALGGRAAFSVRPTPLSETDNFQSPPLTS